jgi:phosphoglycolate phosphatase
LTAYTVDVNAPINARRYQLVIFDFDGTLADSAHWTIRTLNEISGKFGIRHVSEQEIDMLRGRSNTEIVRHLGVPLWKLPKIANEMRKRVAADIDQIKLFPGIREMLRALHAGGIHLAIVSSNSEANVRQVLGPETAQLIATYDCEAAMFGKARKLRAVMRRAAVTPATTLYIGDETRDIEAAREVRVDSAAVTWGYAKPEILNAFAPTLTFNAVSELHSLTR